MDETGFSPHRDHFDRAFTHVKVEDRAGIGQDVPEGTCGFDDRTRVFVIERATPAATSISDRSASRAMNWICVLFPTLIQVPLGAPVLPSPGYLKECILCTERCVLDHRHPVLLSRNITEQIPSIAYTRPTTTAGGSAAEDEEPSPRLQETNRPVFPAISSSLSPLPEVGLCPLRSRSAAFQGFPLSRVSSGNRLRPSPLDEAYYEDNNRDDEQNMDKPAHA